MDHQVAGIDPGHFGEGGEPAEGFEMKAGVVVDHAGETTGGWRVGGLLRLSRGRFWGWHALSTVLGVRCGHLLPGRRLWHRLMFDGGVGKWEMVTTGSGPPEVAGVEWTTAGGVVGPEPLM